MLHRALILLAIAVVLVGVALVVDSLAGLRWLIQRITSLERNRAMSSRKLTGDHNQCPTCKEYFNSTKAFDKHRVGLYGYHGRRCLSVQEMLDKGMSKNSGDWWVTEVVGNALSRIRLSPQTNATVSPYATLPGISLNRLNPR